MGHPADWSPPSLLWEKSRHTCAEVNRPPPTPCPPGISECHLQDQGGPPSKDSVLLRDRRGDEDTEQKPREDGGRDGREAATRRPPVGHQLEPPETARGWKDPPLEPLEGALPWDPLTSDVWSPGLRRVRFGG